MRTAVDRRVVLAVILAGTVAGLAPAAADVVVTKSGKRYEGKVTDQSIHYLLVRPDGGRMTFPKSMVLEVVRKPVTSSGGSASPGATRPPQPAPKPSGGAKSVVSVDFGGSDPGAGTGGQVMEVVCTGLGLSAEQAIQNAFSRAIEQVVGVLVDAETLVKNDRIVSDKVLTFSRGFVRSYDVVKRWQSANLHHAKIRAKVAVSALAGKLQASNIAVRKVPGELLYRQVTFDLRNEKQAAEIFRRIVADLSVEKLYAVQIVGKPTVAKRTETHATLSVRVKVLPNRDNWAKLRSQLIPFLKKVGSDHRVHKTRRARKGGRGLFGQRFSPDREFSTGKGGRLYVYREANPTGSVTTWDSFLIPAWLHPVLKDAAETQRASMHVSLLDAGGHVLARAKADLSAFACRGPFVLLYCWMGPILMYDYGGPGITLDHYGVELERDPTVEIPLGDLPKVAQCAAFFEKGK